MPCRHSQNIKINLNLNYLHFEGKHYFKLNEEWKFDIDEPNTYSTFLWYKGTVERANFWNEGLFRKVLFEIRQPCLVIMLWRGGNLEVWSPNTQNLGVLWIGLITLGQLTAHVVSLPGSTRHFKLSKFLFSSLVEVGSFSYGFL